MAAEVTLAAIEVPVEDGRRFGIVAVDEADRVTGFHEKPEHPPGMPGQPHLALASMGIYVFDSDVLITRARGGRRQARQPSRLRQEHHSGADRHGRAYAYPFYDENKKAAKYWRDVGTLDAYYEAQMDLCQVNPEFNMYDRSGRCGPTCRRRRRRSSCSRKTGGAARRWTR